MLRRAAALLTVAIMVCLIFSTAAQAQTSDVYSVNFFTNNVSIGQVGTDSLTILPDQAVYIINPGVQGAPINPATGLVSTAGYLCANVYVFDSHQEMEECCSCPISPNGIVQLSLKRDLTANPLRGFSLGNGVIKLVSSLPISVTPNGVSPTTATAVCDAGEIGSAGETMVPDLRAWGTQFQITSLIPLRYSFTQSRFTDAPLSAAEAAFLPLTCQFVRYLGSGQGVCRCPSTDMAED